MRQTAFKGWLAQNGYDNGTINSRIANCLRVEEYEGDLDQHFESDSLASLLTRLEYSMEDNRQNRDAIHSIPINGDIYNGTVTFRSAIKLYKKFRNGESRLNITNKMENKEKRHNNNDIEIVDSYERFIKTFNISKDELYQFGINETILPDINKVNDYWISLKGRLFSGDTVYIRGAGREAKGTQIYLDFYKYLFSNPNITKDPTNNLKPQQIMQELTIYKRNKNLFNYQVSHIFGRTKNPFLFEAPWNIAFVPKIIDPFTGHETKGCWPDEYQELFSKSIRNRYKGFIDDYNSLIKKYDLDNKINEFITNVDRQQVDDNQIMQFSRGIKTELSVI